MMNTRKTYIITSNKKRLGMAPLKQTRNMARPSVMTRSKAAAVITTKETRNKRKADSSPSKGPSLKRTALGDVTNNALAKIKNQTTKKITVPAKVIPSIKTAVKPKYNENVAPPQAPILGVVTRAKIGNQTNQTAVKTKEVKDNQNKIKTRLSNEFEKTEESLYSTALEEINDSNCSTGKKQSPIYEKSEILSPVKHLSSISMVAKDLEDKLNLDSYEMPKGIDDYDKENWNDIFQVSHYAMDIFTYLKSREPLFAIPDYMDRQICLTRWMRSLLVDWMVEIQESFELNHETLYLGVKLVDIYLSKMTVGKETLQLVGAAAMFIASKYDERIPPFIDDFLYICDGAYTKRELIRMEINLLKICNFDLGIPISYRFLRRYARCAKITMPVLTLARFVLEYSLMDYATVTIRDSKLAAASLYLALQMKNISGWTAVLEFYTGYKLPEIISVVYLLNNGLQKKPKEQIMTVRNKYSHKIFYEVAKIPTIKNEDLRP